MLRSVIVSIPDVGINGVFASMARDDSKIAGASRSAGSSYSSLASSLTRGERGKGEYIVNERPTNLLGLSCCRELP